MITVKDGSYAILIMEDTDIDSDCARTQQSNDPQYLTTHSFQFILVWVISAAYSIYIKYCITYRKFRLGRR